MSGSEKDAAAQKQLQATEAAVAFDQPATLVNRFMVCGGPEGMTRIMLMEQVGPMLSARGAYIMSTEAAAQLRDVLVQVLKPKGIVLPGDLGFAKTAAKLGANG